MYGLVNKAIRDLVTSEFGEERWHEVADAAGVEHTFIGMDSYDDDVTYRLVGAASEKLGIDAEEVLRQFGSYWIRFTATEGYGPLVEALGDTLPEFLTNLGNDLHARVALTMPDLKPPEFSTEEVAENHFRVHYLSHRVGLKPMVQGLLEGLAERYEATAEVSHIETIGDSPIHEVFEVRIL